MKKIYLDSCFVIYLVERVEPFSSLITNAFAKNINSIFCISPLVRLEVLVYPMRNNDHDLTKNYEDFLAELEVLSITDKVQSIYQLRDTKALIILKAQRDQPTASGILTISYNNTKDCKQVGTG
jgi:predicted nucleic acid-binding protein